MTAPPLILVCDHRGEGLAERAEALAAGGYALEHSSTLRGSLERIGRLAPDLILVQPLTDGASVELDAIEDARSDEIPVPVLVVGEVRDRFPAAVGIRARERGLWDLVSGEASPEELALRVELLRQQAESLREMSQLRHRATHDDRTDLLRPRSFQDRLREHFSAAQRHGLDLAFLLLDLDRFGQINKRYDHTVGDALITEVAGAIRASLRAEDIAGRLGGDEFGVLLPYTKKVDAAHVVQRLLEEIHGLTGEVDGAGDTEISVSIGFETFDGKDVESLEVLRRHAERALQDAKREGGNRAVYFRGQRPEAAAT